MKTTVPLSMCATVAVKNSAGEWVEIGHTTDLKLSVEQEEWLEAPFRPRREVSVSMEIAGTEAAINTLVELARDASTAG